MLVLSLGICYTARAGGFGRLTALVVTEPGAGWRFRASFSRSPSTRERSVEPAYQAVRSCFSPFRTLRFEAGHCFGQRPASVLLGADSRRANLLLSTFQVVVARQIAGTLWVFFPLKSKAEPQPASWLLSFRVQNDLTPHL
jgi:hypothetical protein